MSLYENDSKDVINFLKNGSAQACANLVTRHQNTVFRTCYSVIRDKQIAEEIAQDVFLRAFEKLHKLDNPRLFRSWIVRIAYRMAIDQRRKKKYYFDSIDENFDISDGNSPIDKDISDHERRQVIVNAINGLGKPDSSIFMLYYLEDMNTEEIATILKLSKSNVKIRLMRGREKLKKKLKNVLKQF
ncbi:MAG: sigma-70 family RNA polymerase sigma factor [Saonia sp.]